MEQDGELHFSAAFHPGKNYVTHCIGRYLDPKTSLDFVQKGKAVAPIGTRTPHRPIHSLVATPSGLLLFHLAARNR
jgi:hypothetical protein